jgi:hypothetical protein
MMCQFDSNKKMSAMSQMKRLATAIIYLMIGPTPTNNYKRMNIIHCTCKSLCKNECERIYKLKRRQSVREWESLVSAVSRSSTTHHLLMFLPDLPS